LSSTLDTSIPEPADLTQSLIGRLRAGDDEAGRLLDDLYRDTVFQFCWSYLNNREDAEDAVQEVFCRVLRADFVPDNFRAWMLRIARNLCYDMGRRRARRGGEAELPAESQLGGSWTGSLTRLVRVETRSRIKQILATLPESQQEILRLRYAVGLSRAEIAEVLDLKESIVKSRLFEGLKKLRQHDSLLD